MVYTFIGIPRMSKHGGQHTKQHINLSWDLSQIIILKNCFKFFFAFFIQNVKSMESTCEILVVY